MTLEMLQLKSVEHHSQALSRMIHLHLHPSIFTPPTSEVRNHPAHHVPVLPVNRPCVIATTPGTPVPPVVPVPVPRRPQPRGIQSGRLGVLEAAASFGMAGGSAWRARSLRRTRSPSCADQWRGRVEGQMGIRVSGSGW